MDVKFQGMVVLKSSLSHIGETIGNQSLLRREKVIQEDGSVGDVFVYSGNAFRGQLRDCGVLYFLRKVGIETLPLESFYFLFSGGALTKSSNHIDLDMANALRKIIPLVSIFGGAIGNQIMPGKLIVGKMYPITKECKRQIPEGWLENTGLVDLPSWRTWLAEEEYTRKDDAKDYSLKELIAEEAINNERAPQQMRYSVETIAAGAMFYHEMRLKGVSQIEYGAFVSCLEEFSRHPFLGGKSAIGHGQAELRYDKCKIAPDISTLDDEMRQAKNAYDEFLKEYERYLALSSIQEEIRMMLNAPAQTTI